VKVIVVTGGIASGKSTVVEILREMGGAGVELGFIVDILLWCGEVVCLHDNCPI
jgi:dephospho-CoA kinase